MSNRGKLVRGADLFLLTVLDEPFRFMRWFKRGKGKPSLGTDRFVIHFPCLKNSFYAMSIPLPNIKTK